MQSTVDPTVNVRAGSASPPDYSQLYRIAVLVPCHNEEAAVSQVVTSFRRTLPNAVVYVYDNNSTDRTVEIAAAAGAVVLDEPLQGKGNVVRRMFCDVEADVYVLVDGDATYEAESAPIMIQMLLEKRLDMVNGRRVTEIVEAYRRGHKFGNSLLTNIVRWIFGDRIKDMLSGYRVFSRRFVKSFPVLSAGFEIETELTIHALDLGLPIGELATPYRDRPPNSVSKLRTYSDGLSILRTIVILIKEVRPLQFFSITSLFFFAVGVILGFPIFIEFHRTHLVPRLPTAILSTGIMLIAVLSLVCAFILDSVAKGRKETKRLAYMSIPLSAEDHFANRLVAERDRMRGLAP